MHPPWTPKALKLAVIGTTVTALALQAWVLVEGRQRALDLIATRAANRAQATAHQVQGLLRQIDLVLLDIRDQVDAEEIAQGPSRDTEARAAAMRAYLRAKNERIPQLLRMHIVSADGRYVYSSHDDVPMVSIADRDYFRRQREAVHDELNVSEALYGRVTSRWVLFPSRRLMTRQGQFAGIVFAVLDAEALGSMMTAVDRQHWVLALYDRELRLLAGPPSKEGIGQTSRDPILLDWARNGGRAFRGAHLGLTEPHVWAIQELEDLPFLTVAGFSQAQALQQWRRDLRIHLGVAALLLTGCAIVLWLQHRHQRNFLERQALEAQLHQAQKLDALGQLAGGVAHDFNNMLSAILSSAELLGEEAIDPRQRRICATIVAAAERAGQLTHKLLAFARKGKMVSVPTDAHQVIREAIALLEHAIDPRITLETRLEAPRCTVVGDPSQIQNALLNLGVNARDAMPEGGCIRFTTNQVSMMKAVVAPFPLEAGDYLEITVTDTGCGIPEADLPHVFDPFFTTKEPGKGTGLGLASVYGTMVSHRGAVRVESTRGKGTAFHLLLPLAQAEVPPVQAPGLTRKQGKGQVLVIDDEEFVRLSIAMNLEALGYEALAEGDPARGVELFRKHHEHLIAVVLDMVMPGMTGSEVAQQMHQIDARVPVLLMSGFPRSARIDELMDTCIAGFLQKPFRMKDLGDLLASLAMKQAEPPPAERD